jgi:hypothetical protein
MISCISYCDISNMCLNWRPFDYCFSSFNGPKSKSFFWQFQMENVSSFFTFMFQDLSTDILGAQFRPCLLHAFLSHKLGTLQNSNS